MKAELLNSALPAAELGEGPVWNGGDGKLYWVDITGMAIHRYDPARNLHHTCKTPSMAGFAVPASDGSLLVGLKNGLYFIDFDSGEFRPAAAPVPMPEANRFNDGKCDRKGRLWCGTMNINPDHPVPTGALYRYDRRGLVEFKDQVFISNGLGWSPDNRIMYYTDTVRRLISQYDYDFESGTASNPRAFLNATGAGRPDGMCVDSAGRVLTALWPGWGVEIFTPDGKLDERIELPVPQVSSCAFGGPGMKTLFITTARIGLTPQQLQEAPLSGQVFAVDLDIAGMPEQPFAAGA